MVNPWVHRPRSETRLFTADGERLALHACRVIPADQTPAKAPRVGAYIGMLERALVLSFLLFEAHAAAGFVVAAKSIARFKKLEQQPFAEYYLVGTLLSMVVALAGYVALRPGF